MSKYQITRDAAQVLIRANQSFESVVAIAKQLDRDSGPEGFGGFVPVKIGESRLLVVIDPEGAGSVGMMTEAEFLSQFTFGRSADGHTIVELTLGAEPPGQPKERHP